MVPGDAIILISLVGLVLVLTWTLYRIGHFRKRRERIDKLAREIREMEGRPAAAGSPHDSVGSAEPELPVNDLLLIYHKGNKKPYRAAFRRSISAGRAGILVTTSPPEAVQKGHWGDIKVIWLNRSTANEPPEGFTLVNPTNLSGVIDEIETELCERGRSGVIMFDRFEETVQGNDITRIIRFLTALRERCIRYKLSAIVPLNYKAVTQRTRNQLSESFDTVVV